MVKAHISHIHTLIVSMRVGNAEEQFWDKILSIGYEEVKSRVLHLQSGVYLCDLQIFVRNLC